MQAALAGVVAAFAFAGRHGKLILLAGVLLAVAFPGIAGIGKAYLPHCVAATLFVAALRITPRESSTHLVPAAGQTMCRA